MRSSGCRPLSAGFPIRQLPRYSHWVRRFLLCVVLAFVAGGCVRHGGIAGVPVRVDTLVVTDAMRVIPQPHYPRPYSMEASPYRAPLFRVIRDSIAWGAEWRAITTARGDQTYYPAPHVDFSSEMLLVVGAGGGVLGDSVAVDTVVYTPKGIRASAVVARSCDFYQTVSFPFT